MIVTCRTPTRGEQKFVGHSTASRRSSSTSGNAPADALGINQKLENVTTGASCGPTGVLLARSGASISRLRLIVGTDLVSLRLLASVF
jgi:hypothetical protein